MAAMKERYVFIFDYPENWMIVLYENGKNIKCFNSENTNYEGFFVLRRAICWKWWK